MDSYPTIPLPRQGTFWVLEVSMALRISGVRLFDGNRLFQEPCVVNTRQGVVEAVSLAREGLQGEFLELDFSPYPRATLLPGLIDAHVHLAISGADQSEKQNPAPLVALQMVHNGLVNLRAGITTVRDMGAKDHIDVSYRQGLEVGLIEGPRYILAGRPIIATGGHTPYMGRPVDGPIEARKAVREQILAGVDWVKMMVTGGIMTRGTDPQHQQLFQDEIEAVVQTAHAAGKPVAAHCQGGPGIIDAIQAGIDSLEHGIWLTDQAVDLMLEHNTAYVPTLSAIYLIAEGIPIAGVEPPKWSVEKAKHARDAHQGSFSKALRAGVRIIGGTDYQHGSLPFELSLMVKYGMKPIDALRSVTSKAAEMLGISAIGEIAPGKDADLVVVDGDPTREIGALERVLLVVQRGRVIVNNTAKALQPITVG